MSNGDIDSTQDLDHDSSGRVVLSLEEVLEIIEGLSEYLNKDMSKFIQVDLLEKIVGFIFPHEGEDSEKFVIKLFYDLTENKVFFFLCQKCLDLDLDPDDDMDISVDSIFASYEEYVDMEKPESSVLLQAIIRVTGISLDDMLFEMIQNSTDAYSRWKHSFLKMTNKEKKLSMLKLIKSPSV